MLVIERGVFMEGWKWFFPGMRVKRWIALIIIGALCFSIGLTIVFNTSILSVVENAIVDFVVDSFPDYNLVFGIVIIIIGIVFVSLGIRNMVRSIVGVLSPRDVENLVDTVYRKRSLQRGPHIVVIGGGTGLSTLLRGLKAYSSNITAIVTVADDGGSSGRIREELGILPPGDIRNTLVALADTEPLMERLFQYRFAWGEGLKGHSFGNLFIAAMTDITGDFEKAIQEFGRVLAVGGIVLPSTLSTVKLKAIYTDGSEVIGESKIPQLGKKIDQISLLPNNVEPLREALAAIRNADLVILGPGSLYTSVIPNLLVNNITDALIGSQALKVYVCNVMTQPGETDQMSAGDHIKSLFRHTNGQKIFDYTLINDGRLTVEQAKKYYTEKSYPVKLDLDQVRQLGVIPVCAPMIERGSLVRHDSQSLARELIKLLLEHKANGS